MKRVLFVDLTKHHDPRALYDKPTGGTLTSLTKIPEYLAKHGYDIWVQSTYEPKDGHEVINKVHYVRSDSTIPPWDIIVFNRNVLPLEFVKYNKENNVKIVWWLHDIVDTRYLPDGAFKLVDKVVALSNYCKETYKDFYGISDDKFVVIPNGVDKEVFYVGDYEKRDPNLVITASALIKGYLPLDVTFENLKRHNYNLDFRIYSSQKLHGFDNTEAQIKFLKNMADGGAHVYAPTSQKVLAYLMRKAWMILLPNSYPEICSNILLQAKASGLPIVSSNIGANPEFLKEGGLLTTKWHPHDIHSWIVEFAEKACLLQQDKDLHRKLSEEAPKNVLSWDQIGENFDGLFKEMLDSL